MKTFWKWTLRIFISLLLVVILVLTVFCISERITFFSFYKNADIESSIPDILSGYIPQGYCLVENNDFRLGCGYMKGDDASRIYVMPDEEENPYFVEMKNIDGSDYTGHTGGIAVMGDFVYVTGKTGCDVFSLDDITDGDGKAAVMFEVDTINDPAYCYIKDNVLYSGSFYREGNYETPAEHRLKTPVGDDNMAIIAAYSLDPSSGEAYSKTPDFIISTVGLAQGMTFIGENKIALATSYGLAKSHLYVYNLAKATTDYDVFEIDGEYLPVTYLDRSCLIDDIVAPPMAEQILYDNGRICIMNESASLKYLFGNLTSGRYVYGYKYE